MTDSDRRRFVQQYVERQKAYLPTYTSQNLVNECHRTPPQTDVGFGFDTPVLRPRVPAQLTPALQAGTSTHKADLSNQSPTREKKDMSRSKRKKASTPIDTDSERAGRLADRRERKRKKRAIVNPPQKDDDEIVPTTAPKKGRTKKPAALALLYGFSATNVTKDRLTLKPAPSLGVFSKGRASAKKKVTATKKSSSRNELFSESAFLNKPSERAANPSKVDDDSDDSSTSNHPVPQEICVTKRTKKDRGKCAETPALKTPQAPTRTAAESEVWDIEMQSKLPSSVGDVSSEPETAPVVLDLHRAEWSASINVAEERQKKTQTPRLSVTRSRSRGRSIVRSCPLAGSDLRPHAADVSSLHPSHSASQVGLCAADIQASDLRLVTSRYFTECKSVSVAAKPPQTSRSNDGIDVLDSQDQDIEETALEVQTIHSPINSLTSVPLPMVEFQTRYDMVPLEFPSDSWAHDDCWGGVDVLPWEPLGGPDRGYFESSVVETQDDGFISAPEYDQETWDWYPTAGLATEAVDPLAQEYEDESEAEYDPEEGHHSEEGFYMGDFPVYEGDGSICDSEESLNGMADFLEGRALLLGVPGQYSRLSGLVQAEMDVAGRLRDHWRPLRF